MEEKNRQQEIHKKGFALSEKSIVQYGKIKVGTKTLEGATLNLGALRAANRNYGDKNVIMKALANNDLPLQREISKYFYKTSGIYERTCNYFASMYRYDWYIVPEVYTDSNDDKKIMADFHKILNYLDGSYIKKICGDIAREVIVKGAYYACILEGTSGLILQDLPINYCRTRYSIGPVPVVEFNMSFFDEKFPDEECRRQVLKLFPSEFAKGYMMYRQGKLNTPDLSGSSSLMTQRNNGWFTLTPGSVVKFSLTKDDSPLFISACPSILDLDAAQDLDRRKQMQKLLKVIVQKLPMDKNGELIFDVDEARDIHNNAVTMLRNAIGVDVLTTFTEVDSIDMSDKNTSTSVDDLAKVERAVYNNFGVSQNLFNTDGNMSLEKSILNDEGTIRSLVLQFQIFFDTITQKMGKNKKKYNYRFYMLETTQYNYKDLAKVYKEQTNSGFSKVLPQIALGHSQSSIINTAYFENEVLHLNEVMLPPLMSSTLNAEDVLGNKGKSNTSTSQNNTEKGEAGRPEKPDDQKSDKTIANRESMS